MVFGAIGDVIAAASNPFGSPSTGVWNLIEASFITDNTNIKTVFYVVTKDIPGQMTGLESITDSGGRRNVVYEYPYFDGQKVKDLGRKGEKYTFNVKFHGANYQTKLDEFMKNVVGSKESGILSHPVRGNIPCKFGEYETVHKHDEFNAATLRVTFIEDNTKVLDDANAAAASPNSALRTALQSLTTAQATIGNAIFVVSAALLIPAAVQNAMIARFNSITGQISRLLGQLGVTFSTDAQVQALSAQSANVVNGVGGLNSGTVQSPGGSLSTLPPVYQVGFDPASQATINANIQAFINANQITTQQAVFLANQILLAISLAIEEVRTNFSLSGYDIELQYRGIAVTIQSATESCVSAANANIVLYTVPHPMSLRAVAANNGLAPERQNDIENLNQYLGSVNYVPAATVLVVPAS